MEAPCPPDSTFQNPSLTLLHFQGPHLLHTMVIPSYISHSVINAENLLATIPIFKEKVFHLLQIDAYLSRIGPL